MDDNQYQPESILGSAIEFGRKVEADRDRWRSIAGELAGWLQQFMRCLEDGCDINRHIEVSEWEADIRAALARYDEEVE